MKVNYMPLSEFMKTQREKYNIPHYQLKNNYDILQMITAYSNLEEESYVAPNYYTALYYIAVYATKNLDPNTQIPIYRETQEEKAGFKEAYDLLNDGAGNFRKAVEKFAALASQGHINSIGIYNELFDTFEDLKRIDPANTPIGNHNFPCILSLAFECNPNALESLAILLNPDGSLSYEGVSRNKRIYECLQHWRMALWSARVSRNSRDCYAMYQLYLMYAYDKVLKNKSYRNFWLEKIVSHDYVPAKVTMIIDTMGEANSAYYYDFNLTLKIQSAIDYAKELNRWNVRDIDKKTIVFLKENLHRIRKCDARGSGTSQHSQEIEAKMAEYRAKLDRREEFFNFATGNDCLTDKENLLYSRLTGSIGYADYIEQGIKDNLVRGYRENNYKKKLLKEIEDREYLERIHNESAVTKTTEKIVIKEVNEDDLMKLQRVKMPPFDMRYVKNQDFVTLYTESNEARQTRHFAAAKAKAATMLKQFPDSHVSYWLHFLAVHEIVFEGGFEVFNIHQTVHQRYDWDEDYRWLKRNTTKEDWDIYRLYFDVFEKRRKENMEAEKYTKDVDVVICYYHDGEAKELSAAEATGRIISQTSGISCYDINGKALPEDFSAEALHSSALRNADILVFLGGSEAELDTMDIYEYWDHFTDWTFGMEGKKMLGVNMFGSSGKALQEMGCEVLDFKELEDVDKIQQYIKDTLKECHLVQLLDNTTERTSTKEMTEWVRGYHQKWNREFEFCVESEEILQLLIYGVNTNEDFFNSAEGSSHINQSEYIAIAVEIKIPGVKSAQKNSMFTQVFDLDDNVLLYKNFESVVTPDLGKTILSYVSIPLRNGDGNFYLTPGIYRVRVEMNQSASIDGYFRIVDGEEECSWYSYKQTALYEKIIRDLNMLPKLEDFELPPKEARLQLQKRAKDYYERLVLENFCGGFCHGSTVEVTQKEGLLRKEVIYRHKAEVKKDGTVRASTYNHTKRKDMKHAFNDEVLEQRIKQLQNILQVACCSSGVAALNKDRTVTYIGTDAALEQNLASLSNVKDIECAQDGIYVLTCDGKVQNITAAGCEVVCEGDIRGIGKCDGLVLISPQKDLDTKGYQQVNGLARFEGGIITEYGTAWYNPASETGDRYEDKTAVGLIHVDHCSDESLWGKFTGTLYTGETVNIVFQRWK